MILRPALAPWSWPGVLDSFPSEQHAICAEVLGGRLSRELPVATAGLCPPRAVAGH